MRRRLRHILFALLGMTGLGMVGGTWWLSGTLPKTDGEVAVTVATNGRRLPSDDLHTFFDVGGQRTLLTGGGDFGLGPALAKRIAELFCGRVSVSNGEQAGIVVQIVLPIFFEDD